jgi:hypothetical protein
LVEFGEASQLELGHALLLALAVAAGPDLVRGLNHHGGHGARGILGECDGRDVVVMVVVGVITGDASWCDVSVACRACGVDRVSWEKGE